MTGSSVGALLASGERRLRAAASDGAEARREAELLLAHALGRDRAWLYAHADDAADAAAAATFASLVARRAEGEPVAYLTGRRAFWSFDLAVNPDVLIPRAETELLVELALQRIPDSAACDVADLGTGSGAIALAIAGERPLARVLATDASAAALEAARGNARRLGIGNVEFAHGDWGAALAARRFDVVVANPPYIAETDPHLARGDLRFEPRMALASGRDGLDAVRAIAASVPAQLKPGGWLLLEHGLEQGPAVRGQLGTSELVDIFTAHDLEGRERVSGGRRED